FGLINDLDTEVSGQSVCHVKPKGSPPGQKPGNAHALNPGLPLQLDEWLAALGNRLAKNLGHRFFLGHGLPVRQLSRRAGAMSSFLFAVPMLQAKGTALMVPYGIGGARVPRSVLEMSPARGAPASPAYGGAHVPRSIVLWHSPHTIRRHSLPQ